MIKDNKDEEFHEPNEKEELPQETDDSQQENEHLDEETKKLEKIAKEKKEILNAAISGKINNIRERVAYILNNYIPARNSDIRLAWMYWQSFESNILTGNSLNEEQMLQLTKISSLTRIRAKLQNEYKLFQANNSVKKYRGVLEESKKQEEIHNKPSYPLYSIYMDESGKSQDFLSVGSLWITDERTAFFAYLKLKDWKKANNINYEFHFSELRKHRIEEYKAFFLKFLSLFPSAGFKAIFIKKSGFKNTNHAITDLTFHIVNKGIRHEDKTGRAPLPRMLQVAIDDEEKGSDDMKLENLKERLTSQQIDGLYLDSFQALDSAKNMYIQIVDLFTASVNRKINTPNGKKSKDELADYIIGLLNFNIEEVDTENSKIDNSKVFNLSYQEKVN